MPLLALSFLLSRHLPDRRRRAAGAAPAAAVILRSIRHLITRRIRGSSIMRTPHDISKPQIIHPGGKLDALKCPRMHGPLIDLNLGLPFGVSFAPRDTFIA